MIGTDALQLSITGTIRKLDVPSPAYFMEVKGDYYFEEFLASGGGSCDAEVSGFLSRKISKGFIIRSDFHYLHSTYPYIPLTETSPVRTTFTSPSGMRPVKPAVEKAAGVRPQIKWTNDLVLNGRKLCGILTEMAVESESGLTQSLVIGAGVGQGFPLQVGVSRIHLLQAPQVWAVQTRREIITNLPLRHHVFFLDIETRICHLLVYKSWRGWYTAVVQSCKAAEKRGDGMSKETMIYCPQIPRWKQLGGWIMPKKTDMTERIYEYLTAAALKSEVVIDALLGQNRRTRRHISQNGDFVLWIMPKKTDMTERIYEYLQQVIPAQGYAPSVREISTRSSGRIPAFSIDSPRTRRAKYSSSRLPHSKVR